MAKAARTFVTNGNTPVENTFYLENCLTENWSKFTRMEHIKSMNKYMMLWTHFKLNSINWIFWLLKRHRLMGPWLSKEAMMRGRWGGRTYPQHSDPAEPPEKSVSPPFGMFGLAHRTCTVLYRRVATGATRSHVLKSRGTACSASPMRPCAP